MRSAKNHLIVLLGPTGVGKTALSLRLAEHYHLPIINADSRQIFHEIPIGTAAPTPDQLARVSHFFVGTHSVTQYYSASTYEADVLRLLQEQFAERPIALLAGGSMMYIDAVCRGIDDIPTIDPATRAMMRQRLDTEGLDTLREELRLKDPEYYHIVDPKNPRRIVHALEIIAVSGQTYTSLRVGKQKPRPFTTIKIGLDLPREQLYQRINERVLQMMDDGLEQEAHRMYPLRQLNALNTVGFKEMFAYFDGDISKEEAVRQIQSATRRYMRKQLTWFRKDPEIAWFTPDDEERIIAHIDRLTQ